MKKFTVLLSMLLLLAVLGYSQVAINTDGSVPDSSAILDLTSTSRGLLLPRMTTFQISFISNPAAGLLVYNTDSSDFYGYTGSKWISLSYPGDSISPWVCGDPIIDSRDGQSYNTVQIGTQCWIAENLNVGIRIDGINDPTNNDTIEKYCYNDNPSNCDTYGGLYQWNEAMQYVTTAGTQGICPTGWHLPTDEEYKTLEMFLGMSQSDADKTGYRGANQGSKLAGNEPEWPNGNLDQNFGFGTSGFMAIPGGYRDASGSFYSFPDYAFFWSSSVNGTSKAWDRRLYYYYARAGRLYGTKTIGFSIRCVRD